VTILLTTIGTGQLRGQINESKAIHDLQGSTRSVIQSKSSYADFVAVKPFLNYVRAIHSVLKFSRVQSEHADFRTIETCQELDEFAIILV